MSLVTHYRLIRPSFPLRQIVVYIKDECSSEFNKYNIHKLNMIYKTYEKWRLNTTLYTYCQSHRGIVMFG